MMHPVFDVSATGQDNLEEGERQEYREGGDGSNSRINRQSQNAGFGTTIGTTNFPQSFHHDSQTVPPHSRTNNYGDYDNSNNNKQGEEDEDDYDEEDDDEYEDGNTFDLAPRSRNGGAGRCVGGGPGGGGGGESTVGSSLGADVVSYIHDAKWRRRTQKLLELSAQSQHDQARRAGHVAVEHFWNLALRTAPASPGRDLWYPIVLSDYASVESVLGEDATTTTTVAGGAFGGGGSRGAGGNSGAGGGNSDDDQSHKSFFSRSKRALKRYSICSSSFSRVADEVDSLLGIGGGDVSVRAMKRGVRRGKREHNEKSLYPPYPHHHHRPRTRSDGSASLYDLETSAASSFSNHHLYHRHAQYNRRGGVGGRGGVAAATAAAAWHKYRRLLWFGGGGGTSGGVGCNRHKRPNRRRGNCHGGGADVPTEDADAWMCGVCGRAFVTLEAAEKHEQDHIQRVVDTLPWMAQATPATAMVAGAATAATEKTTLPEDDGEEEAGGQTKQKIIQRTVQPNRLSQSTKVASDQISWKGEGGVAPNVLFDQEKAPPRRMASDPKNATAHDDQRLQSRSVGSPNYLLGSRDQIPQRQHGMATQHLGIMVHGFFDEALEEEKQEIGHTTIGERNSDHGPLRSLDSVLENNNSKAPIQSEEGSMDGRRTSEHQLGPQTPHHWLSSEIYLQREALVPQLRSETPLFQHSEALPGGAGSGEEQHNSSVPYRIDRLSNQSMQYTEEPQDALLLSNAVRDYVILADEALMNVCESARRLILSPEEIYAERQLDLLARDKLYYDNLAQRSHYHKNHNHRHRHEGQGIIGQVQNKLLDAYQLMKEGTDKKGFRDEYKARSKKNSNIQAQKLVVHNQQTIYVNVMVKNGIQVVKNELERLAQERWQKAEEIGRFTRFELFREYAHAHLVRFARLAFTSDFTPRRIAVQLSNDIYRLLTPRLKRRGVAIETEIEYRVGPFFVLASNVLHFDWRQLLRATHRAVRDQRARWEQQEEEKHQQQQQQQIIQQQEQQEEGGDGSAMKQQSPQQQQQTSVFVQWKEYFLHIVQITQYDLVAHVFSWLYHHTHWLFYQPLCILCYYTFGGSMIRNFILSSVTDEIFYYVEDRGLEMECHIREASIQATFMLSALREIRADSRHHKDQQQQEGQEHGKDAVLGPLLGPSIPADNDEVESPPPVPSSPQEQELQQQQPGEFDVPAHLDYLGLELDVPVGFRRLRWAFLSAESSFLTEALYRVEAKYENITMGTWNKHAEYIGSPNNNHFPDGITEKDFIGAEKTGSYLMPKSTFVKANMCTETHYIVAYNDYCFTLKKKALTPDVPYGSTFVAWTQFTVINTGRQSCRLQFSVEPEFPNGPPLVSHQIRSGMRAGVGQLFVLIHETIAKYADEYP